MDRRIYEFLDVRRLHLVERTGTKLSMSSWRPLVRASLDAYVHELTTSTNAFLDNCPAARQRREAPFYAVPTKRRSLQSWLLRPVGAVRVKATHQVLPLY